MLQIGRRTSLTFGNGAITTYGYDAVSRLTSLTANLAGTANDLTVGSIAYNPAGQIVSQNRSNDAYGWSGAASVNRPYDSNGLNQLTQSGSITPTYDARGTFGTPRARGSHSGIDITGPVGAPVFAAGDGTVVPIAPNPSSTYGIQVVIAHDGRVYTQYGHLRSSSVRPGSAVSAGDRIGAVGTTGNTPPGAQSHLRFEVRVGSPAPRTAGGKVIDPQQCLPRGE